MAVPPGSAGKPSSRRVDTPRWRHKVEHHARFSVDESDVGTRTRTGRDRDAAARFLGETTAKKVARYLAGKVPVIETGRLLSLEQVPTVGLRY